MTDIDKAREVLEKAEEMKSRIKGDHISERATQEAIAYALVDIAESLRPQISYMTQEEYEAHKRKPDAFGDLLEAAKMLSQERNRCLRKKLREFGIACR